MSVGFKHEIQYHKKLFAIVLQKLGKIEGILIELLN